MRKFTQYALARAGIAAAGCATVLALLNGCANRPGEAPTPTGSYSTMDAGLTPAQAWYNGLVSIPLAGKPPGSAAVPAAASATSPGATSAATKWPLALEWGNAVESEPEAGGRVWLVPVYETKPHFVNGPTYGHRYLVVRTGGGYSAFILEVFSKQQDGRDGTVAIAKAVVGDMLHGRLLPVNGFEGAAILYDVRYHYAQGRRYRGMQTPLLGERLRIGGKSQAAKPSLMTGVAKTSDGGCGPDCFSYAFEGGAEQCDCPGQIVVTGDPPPPDNGGGGVTTSPGDGGWGGGPGDMPGGGGGGVGGGGSTPTSTTAILLIDSTLPPCADKVLSNLQTMAANTGAQSGLLGAILRSVGNSHSTANIHFQAGSIPLTNDGKSVAGTCQYNNRASMDGINDFTITINQQYLNGPATDLFVSQILLHEILHAALMDWAMRQGVSTNGVSFDDALSYWVAQQGLGSGNSQGQHDAMSLLVDQLGLSLYDYYLSVNHSNSLGTQNGQLTSLADCKYLCWTGLENSVGYQWAVMNQPGFKDRCDAIHGAEIMGTYAATGSQANNTLVERYPAGIDPCP